MGVTPCGEPSPEHSAHLRAGQEGDVTLARPPLDQANWTDAQLVRGCRDGSIPAWKACIARYGPMIYGISRRFRLLPEDCVDVFGQVCKSLLENLGKLRSSEHLPGYIATTTQRACLALIRERDRRIRIARAAQDEGVFPEQLDLDPDEAAIAALRAHTVRQALRGQDARCRELLVALFFDETQPSYDEISHKFALPIASIGPTRSRCLEKFRKTLETMGFSRDGIKLEVR